MTNYYLTDDQFIEEWKKIGSPQIFAEKHKMSVRSVYNRRRVLETKLKIHTYLLHYLLMNCEWLLC